LKELKRARKRLKLTSYNSKKPKCLPQAQHKHFGSFAERYAKLLAGGKRAAAE
jgi:hypothetical protein